MRSRCGGSTRTLQLAPPDWSWGWGAAEQIASDGDVPGRTAFSNEFQTNRSLLGGSHLVAHSQIIRTWLKNQKLPQLCLINSLQTATGRLILGVRRRRTCRVSLCFIKHHIRRNLHGEVPTHKVGILRQITDVGQPQTFNRQQSFSVQVFV
jgi:hypothetical protein